MMGVLLRSIGWSIASFFALHVAIVAVIHRTIGQHGWLTWGADIVGSMEASLLTFWLFLPVAAAIGMLYADRIAAAVERKFYPGLPPPNGAHVAEQVWDGIVVAVKVLILNVLALMLAVLLPGLGIILAWMITAYAIGRGLFVAVAMRRMPRVVAESRYRSSRGVVLAQGGILALAAYIPVLNLIVPIIGVAAMVHVADMAVSKAPASGR